MILGKMRSVGAKKVKIKKKRLLEKNDGRKTEVKADLEEIIEMWTFASV